MQKLPPSYLLLASLVIFTLGVAAGDREEKAKAKRRRRRR